MAEEQPQSAVTAAEEKLSSQDPYHNQLDMERMERSQSSFSWLSFTLKVVGFIVPLMIVGNWLLHHEAFFNITLEGIESEWLLYPLKIVFVLGIIITLGIYYFVFFRFPIFMIPFAIGAAYFGYTQSDFINAEQTKIDLSESRKSFLENPLEFKKQPNFIKTVTPEHRVLIGIWQRGSKDFLQVFDNGEIVWASFITEYQDYTVIDGIRSFTYKWDINDNKKITMVNESFRNPIKNYVYHVSNDFLELKGYRKNGELDSHYQFQKLTPQAWFVFADRYLYESAKRGQIKAVNIALENGAEVNSTYSLRKDTSLMAAARRGYPEMVTLLLKRGADPSKVDFDGYTAFDHATAGNHNVIAQQLKTDTKI